MTTKLDYYKSHGVPARLAARYFRACDGARVILDVGCGTGELGRHRPLHVTEIHGVDIDEGAVLEAARFERAVVADIEGPLPYGDESFDAVIARDILEHLARPWEAVAEIHRVLRPGGVVVASVIVARPRFVWADYTHVRGFTRASVELLFRDNGFDVESVWRMGAVPLADRLMLTDLVPLLLRIPGPSQLWASSWELKARKLPEDRS